ncbi:5382_t:CDS:2 [Paraglomus brasilianum]|uniref:5382_t:CDS:1 n=1 Tax=Paraglomus brasilianum TaxID=144538 RepID=A0A9N8Z6V3_9GLOM|nr:5382_t:CDS:2 [Paraglomus brasilianum]
MQQEYMNGPNQDLLTNSQNGLQAGPQSQQDQLPTGVFTSSGLPTYVILQPTDEGLFLRKYDQFSPTGSIQQPDDALFPQHPQQQWLSQYPHARQRTIQTPKELFTPPTQSEHQSDRQNLVQGVFPIEHVQSQVIARPSQSQGNVYQDSQRQNDINQLGNGYPDQPSQIETDERSSQSQSAFTK